MDKRFIPVAMLAGALALAGCGGGSNTTAGGSGDAMTCDDDEMLVGGQCVAKVADDEDDDDDGDEPETPAGPSTLEGTGYTNTTGSARTLRLTKGKTETPSGGMIDCMSDACIITIAAQEGTPVVTVTSGSATFTAKAVVRAPTEDRTAGGGESSGNWLSDSRLINAVKFAANGRDIQGITITDPRNVEHPLLATFGHDNTTPVDPAEQVGEGGVFNGDTEAADGTTFANTNGTGVGVENTSGSRIGRVTIEAANQEGDDTTLRLVHTRGRSYTGDTSVDDTVTDRDTTLSDYLVYGTWLTVTGADSGPQNEPRAGVLATGSLPVPASELPKRGDARYEGKALGHYKRGQVALTDPWSEWEGLVSLKANFSSGTAAISGALTTNIQDGTTALGPIALGNHAIGSNGKVSGVGAGTWEAEFYGTPINSHPTGIAGSFRTERKKSVVTGTRETTVEGVTVRVPVDIVQSEALMVQGAFGAHIVGQNEDTQQPQ